MKKVVLLVLFIIFLVLVYFLRSCNKKKGDENQAILPEYKKGEMIVVYKNPPTIAARQRIKDAVAQGIDTTGLKIRACSECDNYVELWEADDIETLIHGHLGSTGSGGSTKTVGEDTLAFYSVNTISSLPVDFTPVDEKYIRNDNNSRKLYTPSINAAGKDTITVAVIDTGIDTSSFNNREYLWTNKDHSDCYSGFSHGWNFINNSPNIFDDNSSKHGTIVSHYIINEFIKSPKNYIQIMSLKTHNSEGKADLFSAICAIHYALKRGANIINASWGFYNYNNPTHPYLDSLITHIAKEKGVVFVAAAGNKVEIADSLTKVYYKNLNGIDLSDDSVRKIDINGFYPAYLSKNNNNNIITTTTIFKGKVSATQNYSSGYVDLGVTADSVNSTQMLFKLPFPANTDYLSGSSFAAGIVSGKIGAFLPKNQYHPNIKKAEILERLSTIHSTYSIPAFILENDTLTNNNLIRKGKFTFPNR